MEQPKRALVGQQSRTAAPRASLTAAQAEPFADASVGNVTGSNSVNVFLGLGLPWFIASLYWRSVGATVCQEKK